MSEDRQSGRDPDEAIYLTRDPDYIYSGRIAKNGTLDDDYLWLYIRQSVNEGKSLQIQSTSDYPVKMELKLTEKQADSLYRCLHNALRLWQGKDT